MSLKHTPQRADIHLLRHRREAYRAGMRSILYGESNTGYEERYYKLIGLYSYWQRGRDYAQNQLISGSKRLQN